MRAFAASQVNQRIQELRASHTSVRTDDVAARLLRDVADFLSAKSTEASDAALYRVAAMAVFCVEEWSDGR